ncbi:MAG: hypothetical protein RR812_03970 [Vagococcus sp.]
MTETVKSIEIVSLNIDNKAYYSSELGILFIQEQTDKNLKVDQLTADASRISSALKGIDSFMDYRLSDSNITTEEINILNGLLAAVHSLASKHEKELMEYSTEG